MNNVSRNIENYLFVFGILIIITPYLYLLNKYALNIPHGDDFYAIIDFFKSIHKSNSFSDKIAAFFYTEKEHINLITRFFAIAQFKLLGEFNFRHYTLFGNIFLVLISINLYKYFCSLKINKFYFLLILMVLINVSYWEISIKGLMAIQHFCVIYFALLAFKYIEKKGLRNRLLAYVFCLLSTYSFGNGILTFFICAGVLFINAARRELIVWVIFSLVIILIVAMQVLGHTDYALKSLPMYMKIRFFFNLFAGILGSWYLYSSFFVGLGSVVGVCYLLIKNENYKRYIFISSIGLFVFGSYLLTTIQRANRGVMVSFIARYPIYSSLFLICLFILLLNEYRNNMKFIISSIILCVFLNINCWFSRLSDIDDRHKSVIKGFNNWISTGKNFWLRDGLNHPANREYTQKITWFKENRYYYPPLELTNNSCSQK